MKQFLRRTRQRRSDLLRVEALEDRLAPATFTVINTNDAGDGSLRDAVKSANTLFGPDVIDFKAGLGTITLMTGELLITQALTIQGPGASLQTISGNNASRIFDADFAPAGSAISISGLTLTAAKSNSLGGAILFRDHQNFTISDCVLTGNSTSFVGGAIAAANANGGGLLTLLRSTISGNTGGGGGGIGVRYGSLSVSITDSLISGNSASNGSGGGLYFAEAVGAGGLIVRNSTISGNSSSASGGGIALDNFTGTLLVQNSTVTNNIASGTGSGGGIARVSGTGFISLISSVVAGNFAVANANDDLFTTGTVSATFCAIGTSTGVGLAKFNTTTDDLLGQDFKLGALASNGGPTKTHLPASNSPILNLGSNSFGLLTDQRGSPFVRNFGAGVDIGAVEVQNAFVVTTTQDNGSGSLREAVTATNGNPGTDTITFDVALFASPQTITLTTGQIVVSQLVTITSPGAALVTISGNNTSRIFSMIGSVANISRLTLTGGSSDIGGGAIFVGSTLLTLSECILKNNTVASTSIVTYGGAIYCENGTLVLNDCTFSGNKSYVGGAIACFDGNFTMTNCTVSGNNSIATGGGLYFRSFGANSISVRNSTFSGNSTSIEGGGVVLNIAGLAQFRNCTFTLNSAGKGGGISRSNGTAAIFVESCIVSGNTAPTGPDVFTTGAVNTAASLFGSVSGITTFNADAGTVALIGKAPLLGPLQDNGGPTLTHLPTFGSPAINQGLNPAPTVPYDQRGVGYPRQRGPAIDIGAVEAMVLVVTNSNDAGAGSLRQAVTDANAAAGADDVIFDPTVFASPQTITLTTGEIAISQAVAITGPGATLTTVSGNNASRIFNSDLATTLEPIAISGLTLTGGNSNGGGAIYVGSESLTLSGCVLTGNKTTGAGGAVIGNVSNGKLTIDNCTFSENQAVRGGAIITAASLTMTNCTVTGNSASATTGGGGIYIYYSTAIIRNSTITGNSATGGRGGGLTLKNTANLTLQNCTVTNNSASTTGGGLHREAGTLTIESTVVAGNTAAGTGDDVQGAITANFSLLGVADDGPIITGSKNLTGTLLLPLNPLLGPLQDNGGPTFTRLPLPGSPLLHAGSNPAALATDQRGLPRSVGLTDIGAVEDQTPPLNVTSYTVNNGNPQRSRLTTIQVNFASPVDAAQFQTLGGVTLTRTAATGSGTVGTVVNTSNGLIVSPGSGMVNSVTLTFANVMNPGVQSGSLADGRYQLAIPSANFISTLNDPTLRRLFGDANGDGTVDGNDLAAFGADFGTTGVSAFDFNNDLTVDALDFGEFGNRFGLTL